MPDVLVRHIDDAMAERIKTLARERKWSINEVILHALRFGLGLSGEELAQREFTDPRDVARLAGTWSANEARAFDDALAALTGTPDGLFAEFGPASEDDDDAS